MCLKVKKKQQRFPSWPPWPCIGVKTVFFPPACVVVWPKAPRGGVCHDGRVVTLFVSEEEEEDENCSHPLKPDVSALVAALTLSQVEKKENEKNNFSLLLSPVTTAFFRTAGRENVLCAVFFLLLFVCVFSRPSHCS